MVDLYATLIINKKRSFSSVPSRLQDAVRDRLYELGYDTDGNPIPENE
jgi:hypothetical protein